MSQSWRNSDGPTLLTLMALGAAMGVFIDLILVQHNKEFVTGLILAGGGLAVVSGASALNTRGPLRAALLVFATIGLSMFVTGFYAPEIARAIWSII